MSEVGGSFIPVPVVHDRDGPPGSFAPLGPEIKVLLVWPRFPPSFWGFEGMLEIVPESSIMPPLGLITVAALCPAKWQLRLIDRAFEPLTDEDLNWADLVMVSAMFAQQADARVVLSRARSLGRRTFIGGPWASSQPEVLVHEADHVLVGEAEDMFPAIASALENGTAPRLYVASEKPDMTRSPLPRYDLLELNRYASMSVQFSRGCPFQCEFCDIITIYGRRPRVKIPAQVLRELDLLRRLGWRKEVFMVDDNFIGNHKRALELTREIAAWQQCHGYPFCFYTEASIDLAERTELLAAMRDANFLSVFIGVETPSPESLEEARKFQNLRSDNLQQIRAIQRSGLWVCWSSEGVSTRHSTWRSPGGSALCRILFRRTCSSHRFCSTWANRGLRSSGSSSTPFGFRRSVIGFRPASPPGFVRSCSIAGSRAPPRSSGL